MAFIVLRRSRNTRSYYLVESYRDDQGKTRRRTLCYLGREQDGTDTLAKRRWECPRRAVRWPYLCGPVLGVGIEELHFRRRQVQTGKKSLLHRPKLHERLVE